MDNGLQQFRQQIANHFSLEDLKVLAYDLNLNWDELAGQTLSAKIISLVTHVHHQDRLPELVAYLTAARPRIIWPTTNEISQSLQMVGLDTSPAPNPVERLYSFVAARLPGEAWEPRNKLALLHKVRTFWVDGVLDRSVHGMAMLDLGKEEAASTVDTPRPWKMVVEVPEQANWQEPAQRRIIDIYEELDAQTERTLLILGAPGSGKTITLLELARDSIARAEQQPDLPLPVIFNLSSWGEKQQPLSDWLVEELNLKYQIPKRLGREWVTNDTLMFLLDGLDEVLGELRDGCVAAINAFRQEHGLAPIVVCSRAEDYDMLDNRLQFQRAIRLLPLQADQIEAYLDAAGEPLASLRLALAQDETLQELAQSPLMLSIMALAYRDIPVASFVHEALATTEARRKHLFDAYVERMLHRRGVSEVYTPQQTIRWLSWLAKNMAKHSQSVFLLEQLQPSWLSTASWRWGYLLLERFVEGLLLYSVIIVLIIGTPNSIESVASLIIVPLGIVYFLTVVRWAVWRLGRDPVRDFEQLEPKKKRRFLFQRRKKRLRWSYRFIEMETVAGWLVVFVLCSVPLLGQTEVPDPGVFWRRFLGFLAGGLLGLLLGFPSSIVFARREPVVEALKSAIRTREGLSWSWRQFGGRFILFGLLPFALAFTIATRSYQESLQTSILLRNGQTGDVIAFLGSQAGELDSVTFSPNGRFLLTTNDEETAYLWNAQTGAKLAEVPNVVMRVDSDNFSPDGRFFLVSGDPGSFRLWNAESGTEVAILEGDTEQTDFSTYYANSAVFSPDGRFILLGTRHSVHLFDGQSGFEIAKLSGLTDDIWQARFSPDGRLILTTSVDNTIRLWDGETGEAVAVSTVDIGTARSAEFSEDGSLIFAWSGNEIQIWNGQTAEKIALLTGQSDRFWSVFYSPDGRHLVTVGEDDVARLWDVQAGAEIAVLRSPTDKITFATFSPDGRFLMTGSPDASSFLLDAQTGTQIATLDGHFIPDFVYGIVASTGQFSPDGRFLLTRGWDETASLWDGQTGAAIATLREPGGTVNGVEFSPDGRFIVTKSIGATAHLWDGQTGEEISLLEGHKADIFEVAYSPDSSRLLTTTQVNDSRATTLLAWIPGLLIGVFYGLQTRVLETKKVPNQGIKLTLKNGILVAISVAVVISLPLSFSDIYNSSSNSVLLASLIGYYVFVWFAGINVTRHYLLRLILILSDCTPRRYVHFLDFAADRIFLQKVGGGYYIFIHRLLLEYFAAQRE